MLTPVSRSVFRVNSCRKNILCFNKFASFWSNVPLQPPDVIFGLSEAYNKDSNPNKINLGVGAYRQNDGSNYILNSVTKAQKMIIDKNMDKEYAGIAGYNKFCKLASHLAFKNEMNVESDERIASIQTVSGTGALRIIGEFYNKFMENKDIWLPDPTWPNHLGIYRETSLNIKRYNYYDKKTMKFDLNNFLDTINEMSDGSTILLHACAHNPTGIDPNIDQWKTIANILKSRNINILFDMAYQGFATGDLNQDSFAPRLFIQKGINISLCQSFSKNMGLYGERIGALHVITNDKKEAKHVLSQLKNIVRPMYSNPPINGARIVSIVLDNKELTNEWQNELKIMSSRITQMRKELRAELEIAGSKKDWSHIVDQIGMFCFSGLSKNQVEKLVNEYSIYLTKDGRISMAGVNPNNVEYLAKSIHSVE